MEEVNKPLLAVVVIQSIYAGYFVITKLAFDVGMNTFVFVFYRQAAATLFLAPIAIFFESFFNFCDFIPFFITVRQREECSTVVILNLHQDFLAQFVWDYNELDIVGVGLKYTSASLGAASSNTVPVITFFLAVLLRMEKVKIRRRSGMMKVAGVSLCMGGVATIAFYRGPFLKILTHHHLINNHMQRLQDHVPSLTTWIKGVFLMLLSSFSWALWLVLQTKVLSILVGTAQFCRPGETVSLAENEGPGLNVS
ncbi:WAT1-related protein [Sesamum angolense]|uniref:WAT1-related protein n=1 Tax=Sesamum angolense TaxID=2727404 RepID=A0AAE1WJ14_9LAMI|nr:WAT1-related protein [Sesamum angolense]